RRDAVSELVGRLVEPRRAKHVVVQSLDGASQRGRLRFDLELGFDELHESDPSQRGFSYFAGSARPAAALEDHPANGGAPILAYDRPSRPAGRLGYVVGDARRTSSNSFAVSTGRAKYIKAPRRQIRIFRRGARGCSRNRVFLVKRSAAPFPH